MQWKKILLGSILASVGNVILVGGIIGAYAFNLAIQAQGEPDSDKIEAFANQFTVWGAPTLAIVLTFFISLWVIRKIETQATLHGLLIGLIAAVLSFLIGLGFTEPLDLITIAEFMLIIGAGWLGSLFSPRGG